MDMPSLLTLLHAFAAVIVLYFTGLAVFRIYFHPLAKYPGPLLAKVTQWPEARSAFRGRRFLDLHLMHEKYGDVVRFAPNSLSFRTVGALQDIYTDRRANVIKTGWTDVSLRISPGITTQVISNRQLHAARRKLLNHAFSEGALKNLEQYVLANIREWCGYMAQPKENSEKHSPWGKEREMGQWSTNLAFDVLGDLCFGKSFDAMKQGNSYIQKLIMSSAEFTTMAHRSDKETQVAYLPVRTLILPFAKPSILSRLGNNTVKQKVRYRQDIGVMVQRRFSLEKANSEKLDQEHRKDFFHYLLHAKNPETGETFQPADLVGEAALLVAAGADTSSTAMSACFFYLVRDPRVLRKLQEEVRATFNDVEEIKWGVKVTGLPYLRGCIDEALRMSPPVPGLLERRVLSGGMLVDGHSIPEGTLVGVPNYAVHHNEEYYPRPFEFLPERWVEGSDPSVTGFEVTPEMVSTAKSAFHAFSSGTRNCVGKNMAYMEMLITLARTMWLFDIRLKEGDHSGEGGPELGPGRERTGEYQLTDWFISERHGPVLEFKKREVL
ncbi:hypothetical protein PV08_04748 [Exophiala spinifera]|uniref:Uncharacterized protein n=1 Tax=Exophiala spinifera TaxID=91928 RepID=A0A0D2C1M2_9EURO|nr:uncharacterized protein PV08_04748 [Exophiala spinifera]KIW17554.1 hypothetical protein PV08_04748 [Exophiala spinifera]